MDNVHILNFHQIFSENASCLSERLQIDIVKDFTPQTDHLYIVYAAHDRAVELLSIQQNNKVGFIIMNSESSSSNHLKNKYYLKLMKQNIVFNYAAESTEYLHLLGINTYSKYFFEYSHQPSDVCRDIDILFIGSYSLRRENIYKALQRSFPHLKIEFNFEYNLTDAMDLTKHLQRAKYVLNIPFYSHRALETHRINKALACGCQVISMRSGDVSTDDFYKDYLDYTDDFVSYFKNPPTTTKKSYPELIKNLSPLTQHNLWIIKQIMDKIK